MSAPTPISSIFFQSSDNHFQLCDDENQTHVTLNLDTRGPIVEGSAAQGPSLQYEGTEGTFSFSGQQIVTETTALGTLYTVTLNFVPDLRTLSFTLFLPPVTHETDRQAFTTIAVKSERQTSLQGTPNVAGADLTYAVIKMNGTAARIPVPL